MPAPIQKGNSTMMRRTPPTFTSVGIQDLVSVPCICKPFGYNLLPLLISKSLVGGKNFWLRLELLLKSAGIHHNLNYFAATDGFPLVETQVVICDVIPHGVGSSVNCLDLFVSHLRPHPRSLPVGTWGNKG